MPITAADVEGCRLRDTGGRVVGRVTAFYRYPRELDAPWGVAAVTRGTVMRSTHLVDLYDAGIEGDSVVVVYPMDLIKEAPNYQAMLGDTLAEAHASHVLSHYRGASQLV